MDNLKATIESYDKLAGQYAERNQNKGWWIGASHFIDRFAAHVDAPARVLDLGCGPGQDVVNLRNKGYQVIGADLSLGMLAQAQNYAKGSPLLQTDMRLLPLAGASLDGVWMNASMLHRPRRDVPRTLAGIHRILRPGGKLYLSVKHGTGEAETHTLGTRHFTYFEADEMRNLLRDAGLKLLEEWLDLERPDTWFSLVAARI